MEGEVACLEEINLEIFFQEYLIFIHGTIFLGVWCDDLTVLEIVYLLNIGMASQNMKLNVSSKIPIHNQFIPRDNLRTQEYVRSIETWTEQNKMILNPKKTKNQIFNFSILNQFVTDIKMKNETLEIVEDSKLLGTIISSDLKTLKK